MLDKLIQLSIRERLAVIVATLIVVITGFYLTRDMAVDVLPDVSAPVVTVLAEAPGIPPEEIEQMISYPIETAVIGAESVRRVTSNSIQGFSSLQVEFDWDVDVRHARQIVSEQLQGVGDQLPGQAGAPFLAPVTSIMGEIMLAGFTAESTPLMELRSDIDFIIRRELLAMPGVAAVSVYGGDRKQFTVEPDPERMELLGISLNQLMDAARESSAGISAGFLNHSGQAYTIRGFGRASGIEEIAQSVVHQTEEGVPVTLRDVADISEKAAPRIGDASINAEPGIVLVISKQPGANTIELTQQIEERLSDLAGSLPNDVTVHPDLFQQAHFINVAIGNVTNALLISGFLVVLILFIFLNNWRATIISLVAIPVSVILSVLVLWYGGFTFNTMTLGGIAIAIGVLVDDAIVFVENVFRRLQENSGRKDAEKEQFLNIVGDASSEIKGPIVLANFAIVVVFLPFLFLTGIEGRLLMPLGVAYVTTIIASLLVALILTPAMSAWLLVDSGNKPNGKTKLTSLLESAYKPILEFCFRRRGLVLVAVLLLLIGALALIPGLGRSFLPEFNEGTLNVGMTTLPGTSLEESNKLGTILEELLLEHPAVVSTGRRVGRAEMDEHTMGTHAHEIEVRLDVDKYETMSELMDELRSSLDRLPGAGISLDQPITHRIDHMLTGVRTNLAVKIYGPERNRLQAISREVESILQNEEHARDILTDEQNDIPQLQILPDRSVLAMHGLSMERFSALVEAAFGGVVVNQVYRDPAVFDLVVRYGKEHRERPEMVRRTPIELPSGEFIRIGDLANVRVSHAPETITRENASRMLVTQANITGGNLSGTANRLRQMVNEQVDLSGGYVINFEGQFQQEEEASRTILLVSLLSLILIFLALHIEFRSAGQSLLIMLNLPLALVGGIIVVYLSGGILSIAGLIGFITLFGIAVRNGIILISRYNDLIAQKTITVRQAVIEGSMNRLQPILMTVVTTALALTPLVFAAHQPGNEIQGPMATVILGGLITATALNMIVVPLLFDWYFREKQTEG